MTEPKTIAAHMTPHPHSIGRDQTLARAHSVMREHGFHHLPVLDGGAIVGIVSSRDLLYADAPQDDARTVTVEEAMTPAPYVVAPSVPLADVCATMAEHHYGCALVAVDGHVIGIFTAVDALRMLGATLRTGT